VGNEAREVGGESFGAEKGAEKFLGKGRGCVLGSSPKWLEQPHPELATLCPVVSIMGLHDLLGVGIELTITCKVGISPKRCAICLIPVT
jgi:hypothetical protein